MGWMQPAAPLRRNVTTARVLGVREGTSFERADRLAGEEPDEDQNDNVVTVRLSRPFDAESLRRNFYATSSCGVCGKTSLDAAGLFDPAGQAVAVREDVGRERIDLHGVGSRRA